MRHVITNVVGGSEIGVAVEAHALEVQAGDRLLLCSDGLSETMSNDQMRTVLEMEREPEAAAHKLLAQALERGAPDNVTLVIAGFDSMT